MVASTAADDDAPRLAGTVAIVTGAAGGLGRAIAERLLDEGASVVATDVAAPEWGAAGIPGYHRLITVGCDVTNRASVDALTGAALDIFKRIDVLVNCAGVVTIAPFAELTEAQWDHVFDVNVKGAFLCSQAVLGPMRSQGRGAIVNIASQAGKQGEPLVVHYSAAKAAVIGMTKALARELAPTVRVNAVCPGLVQTNMVENAFARHAQELGLTPAEVEARALAAIPLGRFQQADDIASAVLFLASEEASEITGQSLNVSGGLVMD